MHVIHKPLPPSAQVGIIQPGKGIELVLNEATKRKSSTAVGFNNQEERVYGDDAYNLVGKLPAKQFILQKLLLGKTLSSPEARADHHAPRGCGARVTPVRLAPAAVPGSARAGAAGGVVQVVRLPLRV